MAIQKVKDTGAQSGETNTALPLPFTGDVTEGNLIVVLASRRDNDTSPPFAVSDLTKTAGTCTLGTIAVDVDGDTKAGIFSIPVEGTGTLTLQLKAYLNGSWHAMALEYSGVDVSGTRLEDSATGAGTTSDPSTSTTGDSAGAALFLAIVSVTTTNDVTITPDAAWTQLFEFEIGSDYAKITNAIERIVSDATSDYANWTATLEWEWGAALAVYKAAAGEVARNPVPMGFVVE